MASYHEEIEISLDASKEAFEVVLAVLAVPSDEEPQTPPWILREMAALRLERAVLLLAAVVEEGLRCGTHSEDDRGAPGEWIPERYRRKS